MPGPGGHHGPGGHMGGPHGHHGHRGGFRGHRGGPPPPPHHYGGFGGYNRYPHRRSGCCLGGCLTFLLGFGGIIGVIVLLIAMIF